MHNASGNTSVSSQDLVISIGTGSTPTISLTGTLTAGNYTMPVSQTGTTTFEDIGYNLWTTKSANNTFVSLAGMIRKR